MMNLFLKRLFDEQQRKKSFLCVGLDPHVDRLPAPWRGDPRGVFPFLKEIIDHTHEWACCFKPQIAYFGGQGLEDTLAQTIQYIKEEYPHCPLILDAKRNDIGSTAQMYAQEAFSRYGADAITLNPYMGGDSLEPFSGYQDKGVFVLCRTSNPGGGELQNLKLEEGRPLYQWVAEKALREWNPYKNVGLVVGATTLKELKELRQTFPQAWFLVPGVGAQGGDLASVIKYGAPLKGEQGGLIVNSSRSILYAGEGVDFGKKAGMAAAKLQQEMAALGF